MKEAHRRWRMYADGRASLNGAAPMRADLLADTLNPADHMGGVLRLYAAACRTTGETPHNRPAGAQKRGRRP